MRDQRIGTVRIVKKSINEKRETDTPYKQDELVAF
jgi:hypothetical protein